MTNYSKRHPERSTVNVIPDLIGDPNLKKNKKLWIEY